MILARACCRSAALFGALLSFATDAAHAIDAPGLAGHWRGEVGSDLERVAVGLALTPDGEGGLTVHLTLPMANFDGVPAGSARVEDGVLVNPRLAMALALRDGQLVGTLMSADSQAVLERADVPPPLETLPEVSPMSPPRWTTRLNGQVFASPVVAEGIVYVGSTGGVFHAVDGRDGSMVWAVGVGYPMFGAAQVTGDTAYVVSDGGFLHALARDDGRERWRHALDGGRRQRVLPHPAVFDWDWQSPQPALAGELVIAGGADGLLHAVDAASGELRWRFAAPGPIRHGAAVDQDRVYVASENGYVHALDLQDGRERWRHRLGAKPGAGLVVHDGRVFVSGRDARLHALAAGTGEPLWRLGFWSSWVESAPVVADGVLYVGSSDLRRISAIDPASGRVQWRSAVHGWSWGTPLVMERHLVVGTAAGAPYFLTHGAGLSVLDRRTGALTAHLPLPDGGGHQWGIAGNVVTAGGMLVAALIDGALIGVDPVEGH